MNNIEKLEDIKAKINAGFGQSDDTSTLLNQVIISLKKDQLSTSGSVGVSKEMKERLLEVIKNVKHDLTPHNLRDPMAQFRVKLAFIAIKAIIKQY